MGSFSIFTKFQWKNIVNSAINLIESLQKEERMRIVKTILYDS